MAPSEPARVDGLDLVERAVRDRDELVLGPAVVREAGETGADRDHRVGVRVQSGGRLGTRADDTADPFGDLMRDDPVGAGEDGRELVAAVSVEPIAVTRRVGHGSRDVDEQGVTRGVAEGVVETLEVVEIEHQDGERRALVDRFAELALERAVVTQPGQRILLRADADRPMGLGVLHRDRGLAGEELRQLVLVQVEVRILLAHPPDVQRADGLAVDHERDDDHGLRLVGRPGDLDRARIRHRVVREDRLAVVDDPARDARAQGALVGEDLVREAVAGDDGAPDPGGPIDAIDRERVVRDDRLERVGDEVQHARRVQGREEPLVDIEQAPLAVELVLQLDLLAMQPVHVPGVHERLHRRCGEDRQRHLVVEIEAVAADGRDDDQALDDVLLEHRNDEDRFRRRRWSRRPIRAGPAPRRRAGPGGRASRPSP